MENVISSPDMRSVLSRSCEAGFHFVRIPKRDGRPTKGPVLAGWNRAMDAVNPNGFTAEFEQVWRWIEEGDNIGLALLPSRVVSLDIDNLSVCRAVFEALELPLDAWLEDAGRLEIRSGKAGKAKLLFRVDDPDSVPCTRQLKFTGGMVFELRFCSRDRQTLQDVFPPSIHPDTLKPYCLVGDLAKVPALPDALLRLLTQWPEDFLKALDPAYEPPAALPARKPVPSLPGWRDPIAEFNASHSVEAVLSAAGYVLRGRRWLRPGSESGLAGVVVKDTLCFSHGGDVLNDGHLHDAFDCHRLLNCGGDWSLALGWNPDISQHNAVLRALSEPLADDEETGKILDERVRAVVEAMRWPEPQLPAAMEVPRIPADILPGWIGKMAGATALSTQTPEALAVLISLPVLGIIFQRRFEVAPFGDEYREPLAIWTLSASPSGSRKSAVIDAVTRVLSEWEKAQAQAMQGEIARREAERDVAKRRIEKLKVDATRAKTSQDRERLQAEILQEVATMPEEQQAPRLFTSDITGERLQQLLVEQGERMAILGDEGGIFQIMAGQYSGGVANLDIYLKGHSGSAVRVDRGGRKAHIDRPAVSIGLTIQPEILADTATNKRFRGSGLIARFLFAVPDSTVGCRDVRTRHPIPVAVADAWRSNIMRLLDRTAELSGEPQVISFNAEARECWLDFCEKLEKAQGEGQALEGLRDWAGKLGGAVARIAGVLELAMSGCSAEAVGVDSMRRAVQLGELLIPHAQAAFRLMGAHHIEIDAIASLRWIRRMGKPEFSKRKLQRALSGRFKEAKQADPALRQLKDWDCISGPFELPASGGRQGGRHRVVYLVNPKLLDRG